MIQALVLCILVDAPAVHSVQAARQLELCRAAPNELIHQPTYRFEQLFIERVRHFLQAAAAAAAAAAAVVVIIITAATATRAMPPDSSSKIMAARG